MTLTHHGAFTRFKNLQQSWAQAEPGRCVKQGYVDDAVRAFEVLKATAGLTFHTAEVFDDLFMQPVGVLALDFTGSFWMRGQHPQDPGRRGWWRLRPRKVDGSTEEIALIFDDTIATMPDVFGPLSYGRMCLVVTGNVRAVIQQWV